MGPSKVRTIAESTRGTIGVDRCKNPTKSHHPDPKHRHVNAHKQRGIVVQIMRWVTIVGVRYVEGLYPQVLLQSCTRVPWWSPHYSNGYYRRNRLLFFVVEWVVFSREIWKALWMFDVRDVNVWSDQWFFFIYMFNPLGMLWKFIYCFSILRLSIVS